jgi:DNA mismatch endonuclease (patch repair protein)
MTDVFTKAKRSAVMARIRSRGNRDTELVLVRLLRRHGITGWRRQVVLCGRDVALRRPRPYRGRKVPAALPPGTSQRNVPTFRVRPDFVFRQVRLALFVDGCFWHGCPRHATQPKNNAAFWRAKLAANRRRDALVTRTLRRAGWRVVRIWECDLAKARRKKTSTSQPKPFHEPERLLSPSLSSIPNGGEGGRRPGEEVLGGSWVHSANRDRANSLPGRGGADAEARIVRRIQQAITAG